MPLSAAQERLLARLKARARPIYIYAEEGRTAAALERKGLIHRDYLGRYEVSQ